MKFEVKEDCVFVVFHGPCLNQQGHLPCTKRTVAKPLSEELLLFIIYKKYFKGKKGKKTRSSFCTWDIVKEHIA